MRKRPQASHFVCFRRFEPSQCILPNHASVPMTTKNRTTTLKIIY
jgi:hypothetical protein